MTAQLATTQRPIFTSGFQSQSNKMRQFSFRASLLGLMLIPMLAGCQNQDSAAEAASEGVIRPAKIVPVLTSGIGYTRTYPGTLEASEKSDLAFRVSGQLSQLPAKAGIRVKKGDLLARLDDTDFLNSVEEREARHQLAKVQHEQSQKLLQQKLASQLNFDKSRAELKSARASLDQAQANLGYTYLYAPFDGVVAQVEIENFQSVQAMQAVIKLQDDRSLDVHFSVPESIISQLRRVDDPEVMKRICGKVYFSAHPLKSFDACYKESETVADPVTRNYAAKFTLDDITELALLPGMTASIEIDFSPYLADSDTSRMFIPVEAIFEDQGKQWVWRVDQASQARKTQVFGGQFEGDLIEVTSGLKAEDRVIAAGVSYVREGMTVRPMSKERGL